MQRHRYWCGASAAALILATGGAAQAQTAKADTTSTVEEVVVTGSFIAGTPKDTAIPVAVANTMIRKR